MATVQPRPERDADAGAPRTTADLRQWVRENLDLDEQTSMALFSMVEHVIARQRQLIEESKHEAMRALSEGFAAKMERFQHQLTEKDVTVSNIARYFEEVVADLTENPRGNARRCCRIGRNSLYFLLLLNRAHLT